MNQVSRRGGETIRLGRVSSWTLAGSVSSGDLPYLAHQLCHSHDPMGNVFEFSPFIQRRVPPSGKPFQLFSSFEHGLDSTPSRLIETLTPVRENTPRRLCSLHSTISPATNFPSLAFAKRRKFSMETRRQRREARRLRTGVSISLPAMPPVRRHSKVW